MADRSHGSRTHRKQKSHVGSQIYGSSNAGQSHGSSTNHGNDPYASSSRHTNLASGSTQYNSTADFTSSDVSTSNDQGFTDHRYHQVPRNWTSPRSEREHVLNHPALAYNPNHSSNQYHNYGSHTAQTYYLRPDQLIPSPDRSRQFAPEARHGHDQHTEESAALIQWAQQSQQEEPWNGVGSVRKRSEYDPYHTKL